MKLGLANIRAVDWFVTCMPEGLLAEVHDGGYPLPCGIWPIVPQPPVPDFGGCSGVSERPVCRKQSADPEALLQVCPLSARDGWSAVFEGRGDSFIISLAESVGTTG